MFVFEGNKARWYRFVLRFKELKNNSGNRIAKGSFIVNGAKIGDGTRFGKITIKGKSPCIIGNYNAFGDNIKIITSNHRIDTVILQYHLIKTLGLHTEIGQKSGVEIGHNCWIGDNSCILPGVRIGNGAIIGAGSVVTKNVDPYAIVGGAPAKFIRFRLPEDRIKEIEALEWWNWSVEKMKENIHLLE